MTWTQYQAADRAWKLSEAYLHRWWVGAPLLVAEAPRRARE